MVELTVEWPYGEKCEEKECSLLQANVNVYSLQDSLPLMLAEIMVLILWAIDLGIWYE